MTLYEATFTKNGEPHVTCLYGKDRNDVIVFIKNNYRKVLGKIVTVHQVKVTKDAFH